MIRSAVNYCLVKIDKRYQDEIGKIKIDPTWQPAEYATLEGIVYSTPVKVDAEKVVGKVKDGDRVFFSYGVVFNYIDQPDNDTAIFTNLITHEGEEYWKVHMEEIFFKVGEEVEMITDNVLLLPFHVEHQKETSGLQIQGKQPEHKGIVKALPNNTSLSVRVGDTVCFEPKFVQKYNILGQEHWIIQTHRLLAKA